MLPATTFTTVPQEIITTNLHNSRRLLLLSAPAPNDHFTPSPSSHINNSSFDANVVMVLSVLVCAVICSLFINSVIKCVLKCSSVLNRDPNYYVTRVNFDKSQSIHGVDKRALKTLPVVKYTSGGKVQGLGADCVICLSEFKEGEKVRILPKCNHGFHVKCIDKWLSSHTSCPTCRQSLVETCQKIIGSCHGGHEQEQAATSSSSSLPLPPSSSAASSVGVTGEMIAISMVPLERENMVRNYRENDAQS